MPDSKATHSYGAPPGRERQLPGRVGLALFLVMAALVWVRLVLGTRNSSGGEWPEACLLLVAAGSTLLSLSRQLPAQSVMLGATSVLLLSALILGINATTGIPFGSVVFTRAAGPAMLGLPWPFPFLWLVFLLNARGTARLLLQPWRRSHWYGFLVIGLAAILMVLLYMGLEPLAIGIKGYWHWPAERSFLIWYTVPWSHFVGWGFTALVILLAITPTLINKRPVALPPDYHPLLLWGTFNLLFFTSAAVHCLWAAAGLTLLQMTIGGSLAWIGMKSK